MLRVSEFCRGPLSPVPSSVSRRWPSSDREKNVVGEVDYGGNNNSSILDINDDFDSDDRILPATETEFTGKGEIEEDEEEEDIFCSVTLRSWNGSLTSSSSSSPASSAMARIPLDVLKDLSLQDGDYASLEKHLFNGDMDGDGDGDGHTTATVKTSLVSHNQRQDTLLGKVVIRLELMDEDEENELEQQRQQQQERQRESSSSSSISVGVTDSSNHTCLVSPIVLANLGISPQILWQQSTRNSFNLVEQGVTFRLRAIHDTSDDASSSSGGEDEDEGMSILAHPWQNKRRRHRTRKRVAGRVLLRPLGRAAQWPWFSLAPTAKATAEAKANANATGDDSSSNQPPTEEFENNRATATSTAVPTDDKKNESDDDAWIYPSRSGIVLQESTLCEVRYNANSNQGDLSKENFPKEQSVCHYEVLRIEEAKNNTAVPDDGEEEKEEGEEEQGDEVFYVTAPHTQFDLDSCPLSYLSHVRRLPLPVSFTCQTTTRDDTNHDEKCGIPTSAVEIGTTQEQEKQQLTPQATKEGNNDPSVTPRRLFASSEIAPDPPSNDSNQTTPRKSTISFMDNESSDENTSSCHPDWKKVATALLDAPPILDVLEQHGNTYGATSTSSADSDSRILHLVGTDRDHDLQACVTTAASRVGMQCLSIRGLAAFGYEHRRSSGSSGGSLPTRVTVGSAPVEQQLAGIDAAFEYIAKRRMEPCVLHLCDFDEELVSVASDDQLRCQIEDRFWSKWKQGVSAVSSRMGIEEQEGDRWRQTRRLRQSVYFDGDDEDDDDEYFDDPRNDRLDYRYTPRILIVISTKSTLKKGPWLERLVFPSITLSLPDDRYIRYLWNTSGITRQNDTEEDTDLNKTNDERNHEGSVQLTTEMLPLLRGRPVQAIVWLKQEMASEIVYIGKNEYDPNATNIKYDYDMNDDDGKKYLPRDGSFQHLERLCKDFDAGRRTASSDVAMISTVSWEDVGGLDHVRAEIMDAIELPLKHPHLFPPNTGRSGILLFGPPGTGKTLVAKAVATECGLPFLSVKGPELLGSYIGESEANIRRVFSSAKLAAENNLPMRASILFFDELDSLAPKRGGTNHGGGVMERVVASLLAELDGGSNHSNSGRVFVLGATNRPDLLDPSLLRPGRLDRLVYLGIPTEDTERTRVLASQLRKMKLEGDAFEMASSVIEGLPPRLSGADMSKVSSGAMLHAIKRLCHQADKELEELQTQAQTKNDEGSSSTGTNVTITIDQVLESWGEQKCTPVITLHDLTMASKDVTPSVSEEEIQRYELLRAEHETNKRVPI